MNEKCAGQLNKLNGGIGEREKNHHQNQNERQWCYDLNQRQTNKQKNGGECSVS